MEFVTVQHPDRGVTRVAACRVPHLSKGWKVVTAKADSDPAVDNPTTYETAADQADATTKEPVKARRPRKES